MCLTIHNQLTLLYDLLDEHISFKTVSAGEYQQIKKLVQKIINEKEVDKELHAILPEIYSYGIKGERVPSLDDHITDYEPNIRNWMQQIEQTKLSIYT